VSLTILYRHPRRPDEAGMTVVADEARATAMKGQLENRGFLVIEIAIAPFAKAVPSIRPAG
jgi:N-dimethylarginine dimethylaminohydrolase